METAGSFFHIEIVLLNFSLLTTRISYNLYIKNNVLGADQMPVTLELILFILIAISAVGYLIKEFQKTRKRTLGISLEFFILFWSIWRISTIVI